MWLLIGIDYQYQTIHKLVSIGIDCLQMDGKVIVNTFHFNVNRRIILSSFSLMLTPHRRNPFSFFDKLKSLFSGPIYRLQKSESDGIVPSQKNSGNRSCPFANNEIANNSSIRCFKIMMHVIFSKASSRTSCVDIMIQKGNDG